MDSKHKRAMYASMWIIVIMIFAAMACNLNKKDGDSESSGVVTPPTITLVNPPTSVPVGELLTIEVEAIDPTGSGVTEVQLMVNSTVVDSKPSQDRTGTTPFRANLSWTPPTGSQGTVTIRAVAARGLVTGRSENLQITILPAGTQLTSTPGTGGTGGSSPTTTSPGFCRARVDVDVLNFRRLPDAGSDDYIIGRFNLNDEPRLTGRLSDNSWYQVTNGSQNGWVFAGLVTLLDCNLNSITVVARPATPTPIPSPTLAPSAEPRPADLFALPISGQVSIQLGDSGTATGTYIIAVQNIGGVDSGQFDVDIILPGGESITKTITNLAPNETVQVSADDSGSQTVTFTQPGTRQLRVLVDFDGDISEIDENNNNASLDIIVEASSNPDQAP